MTQTRIQNFKDFWPFYVAQHSKKETRLLHYFGLLLAFAALVFAFHWKKFWMLLLLPIVGYGFAWYGHFFIEKNRPATFTYFWWSLLGDFRMFWLMSIGEMEKEIKRLKNNRPNTW